MTVPIGGIIRVAMSLSAPSASVAQMVFWFELLTAIADETDIIDDMTATFVANFLSNWALMSSDESEAFLLDYDEMNVDGTVKQELGAETISVGGSVAGHVLPAGVAAYLQADSTANKAKGKKYLPFATEDQVDDGVWNAATLVRILAIWDNYLDAIGITGGGSMAPGVLSRPLVAFHLFTGTGYTTDVPAYQRRRKPNVGS